MSRVIDVPRGEEQVGDYFTGKRDQSKDRSSIEITIAGPLVASRINSKSGRLFVEHFGSQPYVDGASADSWYDVKVTRQIHEPTILEQFLALAPGTRFRIGSDQVLYGFIKLDDERVVRYTRSGSTAWQAPRIMPVAGFAWVAHLEITVLEGDAS